MKLDIDGHLKSKIASLRQSSCRGEFLKKQRELAGLTREQLAERSGVNIEALENAEAGIPDGILPHEQFAIGLVLGATMTLAQQRNGQVE